MKNAPLQIGIAFVRSGVFYSRTVEVGDLRGFVAGNTGEVSLVRHHDTVRLNATKLP